MVSKRMQIRTRWPSFAAIADDRDGEDRQAASSGICHPSLPRKYPGSTASGATGGARGRELWFSWLARDHRSLDQDRPTDQTQHPQRCTHFGDVILDWLFCECYMSATECAPEDCFYGVRKRQIPYKRPPHAIPSAGQLKS